MSESKRRSTFNRSFLANHPLCCFCGGGEPGVTVDHVPPKACFPSGAMPEGFEFPACERCNQGSRAHDQVFGFYATLSDFEEENYNFTHLDKLRRGIRNNFPNLLPRLDLSANEKRRALRSIGQSTRREKFLNDEPIAAMPVEFAETGSIIGRKLACAIYYRETGGILSKSHDIYTGWGQLQLPQLEKIYKYFEELLPNSKFGNRTNIKNYGNRYSYKWDFNKNEDLFGFVCRFGSGLFVWGITTSTREIADMPLNSFRFGVF